MPASQASVQTPVGGTVLSVAAANDARPSPTTSATVVPIAPAEQEVRRILGLSVLVTVTLAERDMDVESILAIRAGTILEFDVPFDAELTLHVGNQPIGMGQAVKSGENFGLRITSLGTVEERIDALGRGSSSS